MRRNTYKFDPSRKRKEINGQQVVQQGELAKMVARRAGLRQADVFEMLKELPEIIKELVVEGYIVSIDHFGNFFIRSVSVPSYSYKNRVGTGMKRTYSFAFKRAKDVGTEINELLRKKEEADE